MIHWKQIKLRKYAYSSKTLLINTLNSGRVNLHPNRIPQSKSMHIMPRGHIVTDPSTFSYYFSLENPKAPCLLRFKLSGKAVIHLQFWAYGSLDSLVPISMSPNCKLMSHEHYFNDKSAILLHPGTR